MRWGGWGGVTHLPGGKLELVQMVGVAVYPWTREQAANVQALFKVPFVFAMVPVPKGSDMDEPSQHGVGEGRDQGELDSRQCALAGDQILQQSPELLTSSIYEWR